MAVSSTLHISSATTCSSHTGGGAQGVAVTSLDLHKADWPGGIQSEGHVRPRPLGTTFPTRRAGTREEYSLRMDGPAPALRPRIDRLSPWGMMRTAESRAGRSTTTVVDSRPKRDGPVVLSAVKGCRVSPRGEGVNGRVRGRRRHGGQCGEDPPQQVACESNCAGYFRRAHGLAAQLREAQRELENGKVHGMHLPGVDAPEGHHFYRGTGAAGNEAIPGERFRVGGRRGSAQDACVVEEASRHVYSGAGGTPSSNLPTPSGRMAAGPKAERR